MHANVVFSLVLYCLIVICYTDGKSTQCNSFCLPTNADCEGIIISDICGCNICIEAPKQLGEECGDQLGDDGYCDYRNQLICQYPIDPIANGLCIEGERPFVAVDPPQYSNIFQKIASLFG